MQNLIRNIVVTLTLTGSVAASEYRAFTNQAGKTIQAQVIAIDSDCRKVQLALKNRRKVWIGLSDLSEADQVYIRRWEQKKHTLAEVRTIAKQYINAMEKNDCELYRKLFSSLYEGDNRLSDKYFLFRAKHWDSINIKRVAGLEVEIVKDKSDPLLGSGWLQILPDGRIKYDPWFFRHPLIKAFIMVKNMSRDRDGDGVPFALRGLKELGIPCFGYEADDPRCDRERSIDQIIDWLIETDGDWDNTEPHLRLPNDEFEKWCKWINKYRS